MWWQPQPPPDLPDPPPQPLPDSHSHHGARGFPEDPSTDRSLLQQHTMGWPHGAVGIGLHPCDGPTVPTQRALHRGEEILAISWHPQGLGGDVMWHQHPDCCFLAVVLRFAAQSYHSCSVMVVGWLLPPSAFVPACPVCPPLLWPWNGLGSLEWQLWIWQ